MNYVGVEWCEFFSLFLLYEYTELAAQMEINSRKPTPDFQSPPMFFRQNTVEICVGMGFCMWKIKQALLGQFLPPISDELDESTSHENHSKEAYFSL